jgi:hypothetical protein
VGFAPFHEIGGSIYVQSLPRNYLGGGAAAGAVQVIDPVLSKNKGISKMDFMQLHKHGSFPIRSYKAQVRIVILMEIL